VILFIERCQTDRRPLDAGHSIAKRKEQALKLSALRMEEGSVVQSRAFESKNGTKYVSLAVSTESP
jgi:hypothetical protein